MRFLEPGSLVNIVYYDGEKQVMRINMPVVSYNDGLLTVVGADDEAVRGGD